MDIARCCCCGRPVPHILAPLGLIDGSGRIWAWDCALRALRGLEPPPMPPASIDYFPAAPAASQG